ncbi:MAG: DegQ family serine endoprotease [Pseudomonadota bacterium]
MLKKSLAALTAISLMCFSPVVSAKDKEGLRGTLTKARVVPQGQADIRYSFAPLVKLTAPAVVNVYAAVQVTQRRSPFAGDPFFERFFGPNAFGGEARRRTSRSLGSGVIVGEDGIVITNHHVIKDANEVKVALADGREYPAEIKLIDERSDLAVLKINSDKPFPIVPLGDSENLEVGDLVLALGNPFGVGQTVTSGIVSAVARSQRGSSDFGFFIQTDASINPGNSGGALVNMEGALIGINTSIFSRSGGSNGIGFAVPSNMVRVVLDSVRMGSDTLMRPWIGAMFQSVTSDIAESLGLQRPEGALVARVVAGSPAERAGLATGDVILMLDGKPIEHADALGYRLTTAGIGRSADLTVLSRTKTKTLKIRLDEAPEEPLRDLRLLSGRHPFAGAQVANLSPRVAQEMRMDTNLRGVVVMDVNRGTPAARFGFRRGDIFLEINEEKIESSEQLDEITRAGGRGWGYAVQRNGRIFRQYIR